MSVSLWCRNLIFVFETGTCRLLLVHIMTLKVPLPTHRPCPLLKMWQLVKESLFLLIPPSQKPGEYRTQVGALSHVKYSLSNLFKFACTGKKKTLVLSLWLGCWAEFCHFCGLLGTDAWPPGVTLKYIGGHQFGHVNTVMVKSLDPQEISDVSVQMRSPAAPGMYQGQWRMCTATGLFYGGRKSILLQWAVKEDRWLDLRCLFFSPERFHRCHLGDPKRRSWRASRGDPAVVVLWDRIQHATAA